MRYLKCWMIEGGAVSAVYDKNSKQLMTGKTYILIRQPEDSISIQQDVIIITPEFYYEGIADNLREYVNCDCIAITEY